MAAMSVVLCFLIAQTGFAVNVHQAPSAAEQQLAANQKMLAETQAEITKWSTLLANGSKELQQMIADMTAMWDEVDERIWNEWQGKESQLYNDTIFYFNTKYMEWEKNLLEADSVRQEKINEVYRNFSATDAQLKTALKDANDPVYEQRINASLSNIKKFRGLTNAARFEWDGKNKSCAATKNQGFCADISYDVAFDAGMWANTIEDCEWACEKDSFCVEAYLFNNTETQSMWPDVKCRMFGHYPNGVLPSCRPANITNVVPNTYSAKIMCRIGVDNTLVTTNQDTWMLPNVWDIPKGAPVR